MMSWGFGHERFTKYSGTTIQNGISEDTISVRDERGRDETVDSYAERCWLVVAELEENMEKQKAEHDARIQEMEHRFTEAQAVAIALDGQLQELRRGMEEIGVIERPEPEPEETQQG